MSEIFEKAASYAKEAHLSINQKRKYTNEEYIVHPEKVAYLVSLVSNNQDLIAAAWLHDVIEDVTPFNPLYSVENIINIFGHNIVKLVLELTDISKPSDGNREQRKKIDREHTANISKNGKLIKLADLIDNSLTITKYDKDFARIYLKEKELLLPHLKDGNEILFSMAQSILYRNK